MDDLRAKVFISCGQSTGEERQAAGQVAERLTCLGFDPFVAVDVQSLRGLTESIYRQLADSEYFLFIDFRRERLVRKREHRGSLFSHQELAIASYLGLDFMGFVQNDVRREGVLSFLQGNCLPFSEPETLPDLVEEQVAKLGWTPEWKNKLSMVRDPLEYDDVKVVSLDNKPGRFFHVRVHNHHRHRQALGCRAFLSEVVLPDGKSKRLTRATELKWAGFTFPEVIIPTDQWRDLDAGFILREQPTWFRFPTFSDSTLYQPLLSGQGRFLV